MRTRAENFLNPSFGKMADVVHIVTVKSPIYFPGVVVARDYMSVAGKLPFAPATLI